MKFRADLLTLSFSVGLCNLINAHTKKEELCDISAFSLISPRQHLNLYPHARTDGEDLVRP